MCWSTVMAYYVDAYLVDLDQLQQVYGSHNTALGISGPCTTVHWYHFSLHQDLLGNALCGSEDVFY